MDKGEKQAGERRGGKKKANHFVVGLPTGPFMFISEVGGGRAYRTTAVPAPRFLSLAASVRRV